MRRTWIALWIVLAAVPVLRLAAADDSPKPPAGTKPADEPAPPDTASEPEYKGPEIRWVLSVADAIEEAAQRNVLVYVHSHGST